MAEYGNLSDFSQVDEGNSTRRRQTGAALPVVIMVGVVLVGLAVSGYIFLSPKSAVNQPTKEAMIGEEVRLNTFSVVMEGIEEEHTIRNGYPLTPGETIGIVRAEPGMKFVLAKLDVNNISNSAIVVLSDRFILRDDNGREYETHDHESRHLQDFNYYLDKIELAVKGGVLGFIAFEVPEGVTNYQLLIRE